jgi:hypothetical protein
MQETITQTELELLTSALQGLEQVNKQKQEVEMLVKTHELVRDYILAAFSKTYNLNPDDQLTLDGVIIRKSNAIIPEVV